MKPKTCQPPFLVTMIKNGTIIGTILAFIGLSLWIKLGFTGNDLAMPTIESKFGHGSPKDLNAMQLQWELTANTVECIRQSNIQTSLDTEQIAILLKHQGAQKYKYRPEEDEPNVTNDNKIIDRFGNEYPITFDGRHVKTRVNSISGTVVEDITSLNMMVHP